MFILAERLKLSYSHYQVQKVFWFCESCVHFRGMCIRNNSEQLLQACT